MSAWACVSGSVCECVPVDVSVPVSVEAGAECKGAPDAQGKPTPQAFLHPRWLAWGWLGDRSGARVMRRRLFCVRCKMAQVEDRSLPQKVPGQT